MSALSDARHDLATTLAAALTTMPSVDVFPTDVPNASWPAVTLATFAVTPTAYRLRLRCYVDVGQSEEQADLLDELVDAVEAALPGEVPRSQWQWVYDDLRSFFMFETIVDLPREDF